MKPNYSTIKEIPSLNGWRAIAVSLVLGNHLARDYIPIPGGLGVTIFFFLSGFLITTLLINEFNKTNSINIKHFYVRRFLRIGPPFIIVLVAAYALTSAGFLKGGTSIKGFIAQFFYFSNYYALFFGPDNQIPSGTAVYWSLAVEEHFYFIFPAALLLLLKKVKAKNIYLYLISVSLIVLLWRFYLARSPGFNANRTYYATDTRIDSILFGCILALLWAKIERHWALLDSNRIKLPLISFGLISIAATLLIRTEIFRETARYTIQGMALMPLFLYSIKNQGNLIFRIFNSSFFNKIGIYSYSIYLSHEIIFDNIENNINLRIITATLTLVLSIGFAYHMDLYVDGKFRRLRSKFR